MGRWKEYFKEVTVVDQEVAKISQDEVMRALKRMKSGKAVGPDDIPVEAWKCLGKMAVEFLTGLFHLIRIGSGMSTSEGQHMLDVLEIMSERLRLFGHVQRRER